MTTTQMEKAERFKALHEREGAFVIPNPWDVGLGAAVGRVGLRGAGDDERRVLPTRWGVWTARSRCAELLEHCRDLCAATDLPVSADLENCFADAPDKAAETILLAAQAGLVGGSIEDYTRQPVEIRSMTSNWRSSGCALPPTAARVARLPFHTDRACRKPAPRPA